MTLTKTNIGTNDDGTPRYHFHSDGHVVYSGPITGHVETADGTRYDVSDHFVEVHPGHADEVAHLIGERYAAEGHPRHTDGTPFVHEPKAGRA